MVRNENTRKFIIEKTAPIFNKKGYVGTYLSDITEATGLTKGSIYGNFKDKNEVALEAFIYNYNVQTGPLYECVKNAKDPLNKLLAFVVYFKSAYQTLFDNGGCAILNTAVDADNGNELLRGAVMKKIVHWSDLIESIVNEGIKKSIFKDVDARSFSHKMIALIEGSILISKTLDKPEILLKNMDLLKEEILRIRIN